MNYKVNFQNNRAINCELVRNINDKADYTIVNNARVIKSLVVNAASEKEALAVADRLAEKLTTAQ